MAKRYDQHEAVETQTVNEVEQGFNNLVSRLGSALDSESEELILALAYDRRVQTIRQLCRALDNIERNIRQLDKLGFQESRP